MKKHRKKPKDFYVSIGYFLLGKIIEQQLGISIKDAIYQRISIPLGLQNTYMADVAHPPSESIHGYDESSGIIEDITNFNPSNEINFNLAWTAGGMFSTLDDLTRIIH